MMSWSGVAVALMLIACVLVDTFESIILPRRVKHGYRLARMYYSSTWCLWRVVARNLRTGRLRNGFLSAFGPLSLFGLLSIWAAGLVAGFALLHWSLGTTIHFSGDAKGDFVAYLYFSGTTFFTLGYGDLVPLGVGGRFLSVVEAGLGFGFLAVVISYVPVLYQVFSRREIVISLLDARAGSPPTAGEFLRRSIGDRSIASAEPFLIEWERWAAELLESHISFPVLRFYRSQHDNQSWVATLTTILDTSAILIAISDKANDQQARLTFAMARHAAVDLGLISQTPPVPPQVDRLPSTEFGRLGESLRQAGIPLRDEKSMVVALAELRNLYEPFANSLANYLLFELPPFLPGTPTVDNWQTSPWRERSPSLRMLPTARSADEHFH